MTTERRGSRGRAAPEPSPIPALLRLSGGVERDPAIEAWLEALPAELGALARTWFARMRGCGPDVRELMHDGYATVCVKDAPFAYVGAFKAHVNVGFFQGAALADPAGLLEGAGRSMRHVKLRPTAAVDRSALEALINAAYHHIVIRSGAPG